MVDLGAVPGFDADLIGAADVASGVVAGNACMVRGACHGFAWTAAGGLVDLGLGSTFAVNDDGWIVGDSPVGGGTHATLWRPLVPIVPTAPGAPLDVTAYAGDGQATVSFSPPASDGGAPITSYTVTASPGGQSASGAGSPITVFGLADGTSYSFTVAAANSAGAGLPSAPSNTATPEGPQRLHPDPPAAGPRPPVPDPPSPAAPRPPPPAR
jgi:hypothetical protein